MSSGPDSADLLAAASLLLAALAVLYGVWYASIEAARDRPIPTHAADAAKPLAAIRAVLRSRAYPLALGSGLSTLVFAPEAVGVVEGTVASFRDHGSGAFGYYDPIEAALLLVTVGLALLTLHVAQLCRDLRQKLSDGKKLPI